MRNPIAIVSALPQQLEELLEAASSRQPLNLGPGLTAWRGELDGHDVVFAEASANSARVVRQLLPLL